MPTPQTVTIEQGTNASFTVAIYPPTSVAGWTLEFRAKGSAVNPPSPPVWTQLCEDMAAADTTLRVVARINRRLPMRGTFYIRIDNEILYVTQGYDYWTNGCYNYEWAIERGVWGTTPAAHVTSARIELFTVSQLLLDNGSHGGVVVEDEDNGVVSVNFDPTFTANRPAGTYWWVLMRTDTGSAHKVANGLLYLTPSATSALQEPTT